MGRKHRNVRTEKVTISIDRLTAAVVRRVQEREGISLSATICNMVIYTARKTLNWWRS